ncbi:hypothetical protein ASD79_07970 [Caulobacter sp. Root655]|nr:hypothetical protein ASD79_07970 [Caulobacter sp. Root655]
MFVSAVAAHGDQALTDKATALAARYPASQTHLLTVPARPKALWGRLAPPLTHGVTRCNKPKG